MDGKSRWADSVTGLRHPVKALRPAPRAAAKAGTDGLWLGMQPKSEWAKSVHDVFLMGGLDKGTIIL